MCFGGASVQNRKLNLTTSWVTKTSGGILCFAAASKAISLVYGLYSSPWPLESKTAVLILANFELISGVILISGLFPRFSSYLGFFIFSTFLIFLMASTYLQKPSCACFGSIEVPPVFMVIIDLVFVLMFLMAIFFQRHSSLSKAVKSFSFLIYFLILIFSVISINLFVGSGLQPNMLSLSTGKVDLGWVSPGGTAKGSFTLKNSLKDVVSIDFIDSTCSCLRVDLANATLNPGESAIINLIVDLKSEPDFVGELLIKIKGFSSEKKIVFEVGATLRVK
jgi:hypothetical protein